MIAVRQHWMALVRPGAIFMMVLAAALTWIGFNPKFLVVLLHLTSASPAELLTGLHIFYAHKFIFIGVPVVIAAFMTFMAWSYWSISYFKVDSYGLTYEMGPFIKNTIPLRAIQDIRVSRSLLGVFLGWLMPDVRKKRFSWSLR